MRRQSRGVLYELLSIDPASTCVCSPTCSLVKVVLFFAVAAESEAFAFVFAIGCTMGTLTSYPDQLSLVFCVVSLRGCPVSAGGQTRHENEATSKPPLNWCLLCWLSPVPACRVHTYLLVASPCWLCFFRELVLSKHADEEDRPFLLFLQVNPVHRKFEGYLLFLSLARLVLVAVWC